MTWTAKEGPEAWEIIDDDDDTVVCLIPKTGDRHFESELLLRVRKIAALPELLELAHAAHSSL